jgi:hypothetical protein
MLQTPSRSVIVIDAAPRPRDILSRVFRFGDRASMVGEIARSMTERNKAAEILTRR